MSSHNFYELLGAARDATKAEIDRAFAERVKEFGGFDEVPESVQTAYITLKSATVREFYDWFLGQAESGTPIECDDEEKEQIDGYCRRWGYELVSHPDGPAGTWLIRRLTSRPPKIPKLTGSPPPRDPSGSGERDRNSDPPRDTPPPSGNGGAERWPPPPLALGSRFFHWGTSSGRIVDVFQANNFGQFQVQIKGEPQIQVWKRGELRDCGSLPGDDIQIISLCERSVTNRYTYVSFINFTRGGVVPLLFLVSRWKEQVRYYDRPQYFGVRNQRAADEIMTRFFYAVMYQTYVVAGAPEGDARQRAQDDAKYGSKFHSRDWKLYWQQQR